MKIVFNSYTGIGAWFMLRLISEGHSVDYHYIGKEGRGEKCLQGLVPSYFEGDCDYSKYDLSIFDLTGKPRQAEKSLQSCPTIGDSELATELEDNRLFGIETMEQAGIDVPPYEVFDSISKARTFVNKTRKRYVFKPSGGQDQRASTTYVSTSYEDLIEYFDKLEEATHGEEFILQEFIPNGCEISTEAWFNGEDFYLINGTLEEKKFMNDGVGPATGCAGNLVWVYSDKPKVFKHGLEKLGDFLTSNGYRGMVDLNTICTSQRVYGLEFTPRFGYDASATLFSLIKEGYLGDFFHAIAAGDPIPADLTYNGMYAASVRISIPPYPWEELRSGFQQEDVPICNIEEDHIDKIWLWDAYINEGSLVTCGQAYGVIGAPIQRSDSPEGAFHHVYDVIKRLRIPDLQYRTDMGRVTIKRLLLAERMGWLNP